MPKIARLNSLRLVLASFYLPFLLAAITFGLHLQGLLESPYANGWDGYFYLIQLKSWVHEGQMHSPDHSPVYWLLRGLYALTKDEMLAFKLLCAGLSALFTFILCAWVQKMSKSTLLGLTMGIWLLFSPSLRFFAAQFPKNLLGIDALLLLLWTLQSHRRGRQILAFALTFVSHRMTAGLSLIFVVLQHFNWRRILAMTFGMAFLVTIGWILNGFLNWSDFARFEGTFQKNPQILAFSFIDILSLGEINRLWQGEIMLSQILLLVFALQVAF